LKHLKEIAEKHLMVTKVKLCVLSVPAEFNEEQREMTKQAAELIGIKVERIISEPTAAALAYGIHKRNNVRYVLVIDIGGG
ncbi:unnamed protein product, partial [Rotaria magnacalcarata]